MKKLFITLASLLAALTCRAQSLDVEAQKIRPGSTASEVIEALRSGSTVIDTVGTLAYTHNDIVIRMAPVKLCGVDGYLVLHTDREGIVTSLSWTRQPKSGYHQEGVWQTFRVWDSWKASTFDDLVVMKKRLEREMGIADSLMVVSDIIPWKNTKTREPDSTEVRQDRSPSATCYIWSRNGTRFQLNLNVNLNSDMLEFRIEPGRY